MFKFFDFIINFIETIVEFIGHMFGMLIYFITFVLQGFTYISTCLVYLPAWVLPFITAVIALSVIYLIINR